MKLKFNLLAGAAIVSAVSLTTFGQSVPVQDGSNASRAPFPEYRPSEYTAVTVQNADGSGSHTKLVANHIGASDSNQAVAVTPSAPLPQTYVAPPSAGEPVLTPTGRSLGVAGASLDALQIGSQIRSNATATREQLLDIEARVAANEQSMTTTRDTIPVLSAEAQEQFKMANSDVKAKEQALRQSISAARNATAEQVAADYEAYAAAVDQVDALTAAKP